MEGRKFFSSSNGEVSLLSVKCTPVAPTRENNRSGYFHETLIDLHALFNANPKPTTLTLDISKISLDLPEAEKKGHDKYLMTLQDEFINFVNAKLRSGNCELTRLNLVGWKSPGNNAAHYRRSLLASLGNILRTARNKLTDLTLDGDFNEQDLPALVSALSDNYNQEIEPTLKNIFINGSASSIKSGALPKHEQKKQVGGESKTPDKSPDTGYQATPKSNSDDSQKKCKEFLFKKGIKTQQPAVPEKTDQVSNPAATDAAEEKIITTPSKGVDVDDGLPIVASENDSPSEGYLHSLLHTLKYVGMAILPGLPLSILVGVIAAGTTIIGLSIPVFGWALLGAVATVGLLAGIGYGIYAAVQQYRLDVAKQPVEPPLIVIPEPSEDAVASTASVTISLAPAAPVANELDKRPTPPTPTFRHGSTFLRPYSTTTPDSSPKRPSDSASGSPAMNGKFAEKRSGEVAFVVGDPASTTSDAPGLGKK